MKDIVNKLNKRELVTYQSYDVCYTIMNSKGHDNFIILEDERSAYLFDDEIPEKEDPQLKPDFYKCLICDRYNVVHEMFSPDYYCCQYHGDKTIYFCNSCIDKKVCSVIF
jgi:hypothetical protein